jgi:carbon storage regulator
MLVLTRRPGESITIGDDIVVTVLTSAGGQVRLGIAAPHHVRVLREEILKALQEENSAAAKGLGRALPLDRLVKHWDKEGDKEDGLGD